MNAHWARGRLLSFRDLLSYEGYTDEYGEPAYRLLARDDDVIRSAHIAEQIMDRVVPSWRSFAATPSMYDLPWAAHRVWVERAIAQLEAEEELAENMGPQGPVLAAGALHQWVWDSAAPLWESGHLGEAVQAAARTENAHVQTKLGRRDASEWKLITDAFSTKDPQPGRPRLRLMEPDGSETFTNRHDGAVFFARGCYQALRNVLTHEIDQEPSEAYALQALAAFSLLASWIDEARVVSIGDN